MQITNYITNKAFLIAFIYNFGYYNEELKRFKRIRIMMRNEVETAKYEISIYYYLFQWKSTH
jgi:hypothetical protein